jgi:hypothetical protein
VPFFFLFFLLEICVIQKLQSKETLHVMVQIASWIMITFLVLAGVCEIGSVLSIILTFRIRPVYKFVYVGGPFRLSRTLNQWDWTQLSARYNIYQIYTLSIFIFMASMCYYWKFLSLRWSLVLADRGHKNILFFCDSENVIKKCCGCRCRSINLPIYK